MAEADVCNWQGAYKGRVIKGCSVHLWNGKCKPVEVPLLEMFSIGHLICSLRYFSTIYLESEVRLYSISPKLWIAALLEDGKEVTWGLEECLK